MLLDINTIISIVAALSPLIPLIVVPLGAIWWLYQHDRERRTALEQQLSEIRGQLQRNYADKLLDKRLDVYPHLYLILSDFLKLLHSESLSLPYIVKLRDDIDTWDSKYALFFSARSGVSCYRLRKLLRQLTNTSEQALNTVITSEDVLTDLKNRLRELELLLKSDIGIYIPAIADTVQEMTSYDDLTREVNSSNRLLRHSPTPAGRSQNRN